VPAALAVVAAMVVAPALGCSSGGNNGSPEDAGPMMPPDAGPDLPPDAILCETDDECDDGIDCTTDRCGPGGFCLFTPDAGVCQDDSFCNGREQCSPTEGCIPGPLETCSDDDVCTLDACDEEADRCVNLPRDFDQDGDVDQFCGGDDCNDRDPLVNSAISEICCDFRDNDCDGETDEGSEQVGFACEPDGTGACGGPEFDTCSDALDVSEGGSFLLSSQGAIPDYFNPAGGGDPVGFSCTNLARPDLALRFTLEEARDLDLRTTGTTTSVSLHEAVMDPDEFPEDVCRDVTNEQECAESLTSGFPFRRRNLQPGTYFVLLKDRNFFGGTEELVVDVTFSEPTDPPANETCDDPIDVGAGGVFSGSFLDVADDLSPLSCMSSFDDQHDLTYTFTTTESQNVDVRLSSPLGARIGVELRSACEAPGGDADVLGCVAGSVGSDGVLGARTFYQLPPGTYFLVAQGRNEVDFDLDVRFGPPTPPPPGEACANPLELEPGEPREGRLSIRGDDHSQSCAGANRDAVYSFELDEAQDVTVQVDSVSTFFDFFVSLRRDNCAEEAAELSCRNDRDLVFLRSRSLEPGTYFVIVESFATETFAGSYTITLDTEDPVDPTSVEDNDICADAVSVPATGGFFTGSTIGLANDFENYGCGSGAESEDAVFELVLPSTRRVVATTDGSAFDSVISLWAGSGDLVCEGMIGPFDDAELTACRDRTDGRVVDTLVGAGTHFLVVDGWDTSSNGTYELDIAVLEP